MCKIWLTPQTDLTPSLVTSDPADQPLLRDQSLRDATLGGIQKKTELLNHWFLKEHLTILIFAIIGPDDENE